MNPSRPDDRPNSGDKLHDENGQVPCNAVHCLQEYLPDGVFRVVDMNRTGHLVKRVPNGGTWNFKAWLIIA